MEDSDTQAAALAAARICPIWMVPILEDAQPKTLALLVDQLSGGHEVIATQCGHLW